MYKAKLFLQKNDEVKVFNTEDEYESYDQLMGLITSLITITHAHGAEVYKIVMEYDPCHTAETSHTWTEIPSK